MKRGLALALSLILLSLLVGSVAYAGRLPDQEKTPPQGELATAAGSPASAAMAQPAIGRPGIYIFLDYDHLRPVDYPGVVIGGHYAFQWRRIESSFGYYDWSRIDNWIDQEAALGKPVGLAINTYEGVSGGNVSPSWVPTIPCQDYYSNPHPIPNYWSTAYKTYFRNLILAFGARYNGDPRVEWIEVSAGAYGENQPAPDYFDQCLIDAGYGDQGAWQQVVKDTISWYRQAFPDKPIVTQHYPRFRSDSERVNIADYAAALGVGFKGDGLIADRDKASRRDDPGHPQYRSFLDDPAISYSDTVPIGFETYRFYLYDDTMLYWAIFNALDKRADYLTFDADLMKDPLGGNTNWPILRFANQHLGKEIHDTPDVWVALRESGYTYYPQVGNYRFFMEQDNDAPGGRTVPLTWRPAGSGPYEIARPGVEAGQTFLGTTTEGWICRRTDEGTGNPHMYFDVHDGYLFGGSNAISMTVTYFDRGADTWTLEYDAPDNITKSAAMVTKTNTNTWKKQTFNIGDARFEGRQAGGNDFRINSNGDGDEIVHFVILKRLTEPTPTPTATPTNTATGTPPTHTPTPTITSTPTATPIPIMACFREGDGGYAGSFDANISLYTPNTNMGADVAIRLKTDGAVSSILKFDVSSIPSDRSVVGATLSLYASERDKPYPVYASAYQVLRDWNEMEVTWNSAKTGVPWAAGGCNGVGVDRNGTSADTQLIDGTDVWLNLDVTAMVQDWVATPANNRGLIVIGQGPVTLQYNFRSTEFWGTSFRPRLCVSYLPPPPTPTITPTPTSSATPTRTATPTSTLSPTASATPTITPTGTHTSTPTPTITPTPTTGIISGIVWNDLNGNGLKDIGEPGLPGATVELLDKLHNLLQVWVTAGNGLYQFSGLEPGTYILQETNPPGFQSTTQDEWWVNVIANWTITINFGDWIPAPTATPTRTRTPTATASPTVTTTGTPTNTGTPTQTGTPTNSPTITPTGTVTQTPTVTTTGTQLPTSTMTPTPWPTGVLDLTGAVDASCGVAYSDTTVGAPSHVNYYSCIPSWPEAGPERVYILTTTATQDITATLSYVAPADLDIFILNEPHGDHCLGFGDTVAVLQDAPPGTYYIVVDTFSGFGAPVPGSYILNISCPIGPFPSPTPTSTQSSTPSPTATPGRVLLPIILKLQPLPTATSSPTRTRTPTRTGTPTRTPTITATPIPTVVVLQQGQNGYSGTSDTWISTWNGATNYEGQSLLTFRGGDRDRMSVLFRYDLSSIPSGVHIVRATLDLYATDVTNPAGTWASSYAVREQWAAGQATWLQARTGVFWGDGGCNLPPQDRDAEPSDSVFVEGEFAWFSWDITDMVQEWVSGTELNYGVLIRCPGEPVSANVQHNFQASEGSPTEQRPKLTIQYWTLP